MINNEVYSIILPGRIVNYYPADQTADIQICAELVVNSSSSMSDLVIREPLEGVPVHTPSGGGWSMTMPINTGDTCILFFSQVGYDHWLFEDKDTAGTLAKLPKPWLGRQFDEDDGFALVGLNTLPRAIQSYSGNHSQWRNSDATQVISLNDDATISIDSTVEVTINAPSVVVNCVSSTVNSPANTINGPLHCTGAISSDVTVSAPTVAASTSLTVASKEMGLHTHAGVNGETAPPT